MERVIGGGGGVDDLACDVDREGIGRGLLDCSLLLLLDTAVEEPEA